MQRVKGMMGTRNELEQEDEEKQGKKKRKKHHGRTRRRTETQEEKKEEIREEVSGMTGHRAQKEALQKKHIDSGHTSCLATCELSWCKRRQRREIEFGVQCLL